jgi:hypothetical protein
MFFKRNRLSLVLVTILVITLCIGISPVSAIEVPKLSNRTIPAVYSVEEVDPLLYDMTSYAKEQGISVDEAMHRYEIQNSFNNLQQQLIENESETYAGLYVQHQPEFRIVVLFTRNGENTIKKYVPESLLKYVEIKTKRYTLETLVENQKSIIASISLLSIWVEVGLKQSENRIDIMVQRKDQANLMEALNQKIIAFPDTANIIQVGEEDIPNPSSNIYGGLVPTEGTLGFSVKNAAGTKGVTTAGHCANTQSYGGYNLPYQTGRTDTYYDIQWHTAPNFTVVNKIQWLFDGSTRTITSGKTWDQQMEDEYIFKFGRITGYNGGYIDYKYDVYGFFWITNPQPRFIRIRNQYNNPICESGDSGGPWYLGNTAYGTTIAADLNHHAWYMAINYLDGINVTLLTN